MIHHYQIHTADAVHHIHAHWHVIDPTLRRIRFYCYVGPDSELIADLPWPPAGDAAWAVDIYPEDTPGVSERSEPAAAPVARPRMYHRAAILLAVVALALVAACDSQPDGQAPVRATQVAWWGLGILGLLSAWASYRLGLGTGYDQGYADANKTWLGQQLRRPRPDHSGDWSDGYAWWNRPRYLNGSEPNGSHLQPIRPRPRPRLTTIDRRLPQQPQPPQP